MAAQLINGKEVSVKRLAKVAEAMVKRQEDGLREPCLAVIFHPDGGAGEGTEFSGLDAARDGHRETQAGQF